MKKIKIFISSVLKELMNERLAVEEAIMENEFLRDFKRLMALELIRQKGAGRATHYVLKE